MFFYGYRCYIKKHDFTNDTLNFPFDDEEDEFLGCLAQGDGPAQGDGHAPGGGPSIEDKSHGKKT